MSDKLEQAFPHGDPVHGGCEGMTLRDYFAGQALMGLCGNSFLMQVLARDAYKNGKDDIWINETISVKAYKQADAMLKERGE